MRGLLATNHAAYVGGPSDHRLSLCLHHRSHVPLPAASSGQQCSLLQGLAMEMEGFSCREVEKLVLAIQRPSLQR